MQCLVRIAHAVPAGLGVVLDAVLDRTAPKAKGTDVVFQQRLKTALAVMACFGHLSDGSMWLPHHDNAEERLLQLIVSAFTAADDKVRACALFL